MGHYTHAWAAVFVMVVTLATAPAWAQDAAEPGPATDAKSAETSGMNCQMMADRMKQMREMKQQMNEELQQKLQAMKQASGDKKIDAMAEVISLMATQRLQADEQMAEMRQNMMGHMGRHMMMGDDEQGRKAMMQCPMMKQMQQEGGDQARGSMMGGGRQDRMRQRMRERMGGDAAATQPAKQ